MTRLSCDWLYVSHCGSHEFLGAKQVVFDRMFTACGGKHIKNICAPAAAPTDLSPHLEESRRVSGALPPLASSSRRRTDTSISQGGANSSHIPTAALSPLPAHCSLSPPLPISQSIRSKAFIVKTVPGLLLVRFVFGVVASLVIRLPMTHSKFPGDDDHFEAGSDPPWNDDEQTD